MQTDVDGLDLDLDGRHGGDQLDGVLLRHLLVHRRSEAVRHAQAQRPPVGGFFLLWLAHIQLLITRCNTVHEPVQPLGELAFVLTHKVHEGLVLLLRHQREGQVRWDLFAAFLPGLFVRNDQRAVGADADARDARDFDCHQQAVQLRTFVVHVSISTSAIALAFGFHASLGQALDRLVLFALLRKVAVVQDFAVGGQLCPSGAAFRRLMRQGFSPADGTRCATHRTPADLVEPQRVGHLALGVVLREPLALDQARQALRTHKLARRRFRGVAEITTETTFGSRFHMQPR